VFGHAGLSSVTFSTISFSLWARWTLQRYLFINFLLRLGTLDSPALPFINILLRLGTLDSPGLPFRPFPPVVGHAERSSVTFSSISSCGWARWTLQRYLFDHFLLWLSTLDSPALPFHQCPLVFGHIELSSVTFSTISSCGWVRWLILCYQFNYSRPIWAHWTFLSLPFVPVT
jgi:Fe-S cluster biosynthesis and repair protein YggX